MSRHLAADGHLVTAIDINPTRICLAKHFGGDVEFRCEDATQMGYLDAFDVVIVCMVLHTRRRPDRISILCRALEALRRNGRLLVVDVAEQSVPTWRGKMVRNLIALEEYAIGLIDPDHHRNFKDFIASGGTAPWIAAQTGIVVEFTQLLDGNLLACTLIKRS